MRKCTAKVTSEWWEVVDKAHRNPTREEVWDAVMECDFSAVLNAILGQDIPGSLVDLVGLKARMKKHESPEARELRMGRRVKKVLTK